MSQIEILPISGMNGQEAHYVRRNQPLTTSVVSMSPMDRQRLLGYEERWRFYQGLHWGANPSDGDPLITINLMKMIVLKLASWMVGQGMEITVSDALADITLPVVKEVWEYNKEAKLLLELAIMGGVTGDCFTLVTWDAPSSAELRINPHTQGKIRIRLLGSHQCFPIWNPRNKEELTAVYIITEDADNRIPFVSATQQPIPGSNTAGLRTRRFIEIITPDTITTHYEDEQPVSRANELGEIPLVHWPNLVFPGEFYGMSDLDGLIDLQKELNQKLTDVSDIVHMNAAPITIITGAKAKALEKGPRNMWCFANENVKVANLTASGALESSQQYIEFLLQMIWDLSGVPEGSLGRVQAVSNTAAAALKVQFGPIIEAIGRKAVSFEPGIERVNYFILRFNQVMNRVTYPIDLCATCGGRILQFPVTSPNGVVKLRRKCYVVDTQTGDFMAPDDVKLHVARQFSYGKETRMIPFSQFKREFGKKSASYWDPAPMKDLQKQAEADQAKVEAQADAEQEQGQAAADDEHSKAMELKTAPKPPSEGSDGS